MNRLLGPRGRDKMFREMAAAWNRTFGEAQRVKDAYDRAVTDLIIADYQAGTWPSETAQQQIAVVRMMQREHMGRLNV